VVRNGELWPEHVRSNELHTRGGNVARFLADPTPDIFVRQADLPSGMRKTGAQRGAEIDTQDALGALRYRPEQADTSAREHRRVHAKRDVSPPEPSRVHERPHRDIAAFRHVRQESSIENARRDPPSAEQRAVIADESRILGRELQLEWLLHPPASRVIHPPAQERLIAGLPIGCEPSATHDTLQGDLTDEPLPFTQEMELGVGFSRADAGEHVAKHEDIALPLECLRTASELSKDLEAGRQVLRTGEGIEAVHRYEVEVAPGDDAR